jgi:Lamin Tail Domain/Cohesin domain
MSHSVRRATIFATASLWIGIGSASFAGVVVNEVHYRPSPSALPKGEDPARLQFVELYNAGPATVDLSGWSIASAVRLSFPNGTTMAPSEYVVVAADPDFLRARGPSIPAGVRVFRWESGDLAAGRVQLLDGGAPSPAVVDDVEYRRGSAWSSKADGRGSSLELVNPRLDDGSMRGWRASRFRNGTPGAANSALGEPVVAAESPARGSSAAGVREIAVTFSEDMKHVVASDLTVDGAPATNVTGSGAGPYVFAVRAPLSGTVTVALRGDVVESRQGRIFAGDTWRYVASVTSVLGMPGDTNGGPGAIVQVPISAIPATGIFGIDMTVQYDAAVIQAQTVTVSGIAASQGFALVRNLNTPGVIIISTYATEDALSGSGEIARIQFQVVGTPGATSHLTFTSASINEGAIVAAPDPGLFTVTCAGAANGTACNDANACTTGETCQTDACTGGSALPVPGEIANVKFDADDAVLTWDSAGATGPGTVHDVIRGVVGELPVGTGTVSCLASGISVATASDPATPPAMTSYWYLVRGRNACGMGTYGFRESGGAPVAERTSNACP